MISNEVTRRAKRRIPRWVWLLAAVILIPAQFYWVKYYWFDRPAEESHLARYPELTSADPAVCAAIRKAWSRDGHEIFPEQTSTEVERVLKRAGDRGPLALLEVMLDKAPDPNGSINCSPIGRDAEFQRYAVWLRDHAPRDLEPVLLRLVKDQSRHCELRVQAVIALCRPKSASRVAALAKIALDADQPPSLRSDIVARLPRMSTPLLAHLRPLLYQPFHRLDQDAAIAVTLGGESEAPTLLIEAVRESATSHGLNGTSLVDAVLKLIDRDPDVLARAEYVRKFHGPALTEMKGLSWEAYNRKQTDAHDALTAAVTHWLAAHPEARATRFERERAAYLKSDARRRELAITSFEDILEADDKDLDLGAAAIWCAQPEATPEARYWRLRHLEYLHRLSLLLADDIGNLQEPEAIIGAMCRRLFPQGQRGTSWSWEGDLPSTLQVVLRNQQGGCVGFSLLLLAMGERLGLPLHGVRSPEHLFVRWDDGKTRRNIETTARGKALTDADYHTWGPTTRPITPEDVAAGRYLRNLTRKQVIASLLNNLAYIYLNSRNLKPGPRRYDQAHACASRAIRLDPDFASAYANRAAAATRLDAVDRAAVLRDIEAALRLDQRSVRAQVIAGRLHIGLGRFRKALHHFERALAADPDALAARIGKTRCLVALDRVAEALTQIESVDADQAGDYDLRSARLTVLVRLRDPRWRAAHRELVESAREFAPHVHLRTASLLLHRFADVEPSPKPALTILGKIPDHGLADDDAEGSVAQVGANKTMRLVTKENLRDIQRRRDELRAQAEALLAAAKNAAADDD